jgi:preprotein translocase subunit SecG
MYTILLLLLLIDCLTLIFVVLLQSGKGGGLAAGFGGAGTGMEMMGSRQTATFLHNATKWLGGAFLVICFAISIMTVRGTRPRSLIEAETQGDVQETPAPEAGTPSDLQDILGGEPAPQTGQPAVPAGEQTGSPQPGSDVPPADQ